MYQVLVLYMFWNASPVPGFQSLARVLHYILLDAPYNNLDLRKRAFQRYMDLVWLYFTLPETNSSTPLKTGLKFPPKKGHLQKTAIFQG